MRKQRGVVIERDTYIIIDFPSLSEAQDFLTAIHKEAEKLERYGSMLGTEIGEYLKEGYKSLETFSKRALQNAEIVDEETVPYDSYWGFLVRIQRSSVECDKVAEMLQEFYDLSGYSLMDYGEERTRDYGDESDEEDGLFLLFQDKDYSIVVYVREPDGSKYLQIDTNDVQYGTRLPYEAMQVLFKIMDSVDHLDVLPDKG